MFRGFTARHAELLAAIGMTKPKPSKPGTPAQSSLKSPVAAIANTSSVMKQLILACISHAAISMPCLQKSSLTAFARGEKGDD